MDVQQVSRAVSKALERAREKASEAVQELQEAEKRQAVQHAQRDRIECLYRSGTTLRGIAAIYGKSHEWVRLELKAAGVTFRPRGGSRKQV